MFKVLLWDIDGTILNFSEAEKVGIRMGFARFGLGVCTDEMLSEYSRINRRHWEMLEHGEITKPQVLERRFLEFFTKYGIRTDIVGEFNRHYQVDLGETICVNDDALNVICGLKPFVRQYAVTNGTKIAQTKKISKLGLDRLMDGIFISEDIGAEKPSIAFFEGVWSKIGHFSPDKVLIVGDSLTSDVLGGMNAGIKTCWYRPADSIRPNKFRIDYEISDLREIPRIVAGNFKNL